MRNRIAGLGHYGPWRRIICLGTLPESWQTLFDQWTTEMPFEVLQADGAKSLLRILAIHTPHAICLTDQVNGMGWRAQLEMGRRFLPHIPLISIGTSEQIFASVSPDIFVSDRSEPEEQEELFQWLRDDLPRKAENDQRRVLQQIKGLKNELETAMGSSGQVPHPDFVPYRWRINNTLEKLTAIEESMQLIRKNTAMAKDLVWTQFKSI